MVAIAITRNGEGTAYRFGSIAEADSHPLVQYGDVVADNAYDLAFKRYSRLDLPRIARKFASGAVRVIAAADARAAADTRESKAAMEAAADEFWSAVLAAAVAPPSDPQAVFNLIAEDRVATRTGYRAFTSARPTPAAIANDDDNEDEDMTEGKQRDHFRVYEDATIQIKADKEGKLYNATDNNPLKGENAAKFAKFADGKTVAQLLADGLTRSDIRRARRKGYIDIVGGTPPAKPEKPAKAEAQAAA